MKGTEYAFVRDRLGALGAQVLLVDAGLLRALGHDVRDAAAWTAAAASVTRPASTGSGVVVEARDPRSEGAAIAC